MGAPARPRLESVDLIRGLVMIVMAIDHTRDYFGMPGANPVDMSSTTSALFLTRWITHFCAPVFFLLTGTGAALSLARKPVAELSRYLWTRGVWLLVLDLVIVRSLAYQFNVDFKVTLLLVLWALGWAMIVLAMLVRLPATIVTAFGVIMIAGHNVLDGVRSASPWFAMLYGRGFVINTPEHVVFAAYPLIPWVGVTAVGFGLGHIYRWEPERRRALLLRLGVAAIALFVILRAINGYGDPTPWSTQPTMLFTVWSFLNTNKYPPSLIFLLMTLGPAMLALWAADRGTPSWMAPAVTIGRVPLFYFIAHFVLIHALAVAVCYAQNGSAHWMFESPDLGNYPFTPPPGWGFGLPVVYLVWAVVVLSLYPLCRWFAALKQRRRDVWLSYL